MNYMYYPTPQQTETMFAYVSGTEGAKTFQVPLNRSALLMDSEKDMFYLKTVNSLGQVSMKCYKFEEIEEPKPETFATKREIEEINNKINDLIHMLKEKQENA